MNRRGLTNERSAVLRDRKPGIRNGDVHVGVGVGDGGSRRRVSRWTRWRTFAPWAFVAGAFVAWVGPAAVLLPVAVAAAIVVLWLWASASYDILTTPSTYWRRAGRRKWAWLVTVVCLPPAAVVYDLVVRPSLRSDFRAASTRPDGEHATGNSSADSARSLSFADVGMVFADGTDALHDISFSVSKGEFVSVVGPSGCGKSTLLRIAAGLVDSTSGTVSVDRERLEYIFQDATLLDWRTVQQNIELLAELRKVEKAERLRLTADAVARVGLTGFEGHYPRSLSGGMKMRCSLARGLTMKPPVFLFDEPFGAVDEITRERLNEETQRLFQSEGFAGLFITHSIREAVFLSTRVLVMSARPGSIVAEFEIPFPYPRSPELRYDPLFADLEAKISHSLRTSSGA